MFATIRQFYVILTTDLETVRGASCLPPKPITIPKAKTVAPPPVSSMFEIDREKNFYGFHMDNPESREGAVRHLTEYDKSILKEREAWGKQKVVAQNEIAKGLWYAGESIADACRTMGYSKSWMEKRYWAFVAALSQEIEENAK